MNRKKIAFVNVGVNSTHGSLRSPIFDDGTFEFVPIPDPILGSINSRMVIKYEDLRASNGIGFSDFIPPKYMKAIVHADPEFQHFTYGDYPNNNPRASNLKKLTPGDYIIFLSRLVSWVDGHFTNRAGFYLIGLFEIRKVLKDIRNRPQEETLKQIQTNAHIIRGECDPLLYDGFWVFIGSKNSRRFKKAIPLDREMIERFGFVDRKGHKWKWQSFHSDLSTIGSYLRSVKVITNESQAENILRICNKTSGGF